MNNRSTDDNCSKILPADESQPSYDFRAVALSFIILISVVGNILVCRGAITRRNRPFTYYMIINLSVAELVITILQPFLFHYNTKPYSWVFGGFLCNVITPLNICATSAVTFTLATIAVYRCIIMLRQHRRLPTKFFSLVVIVCSWIWSVAIAMPSAVTRKIDDRLFEKCGILLCDEILFQSDEAKHLYSMFLFALGFVVPIVVMIISYSIVVCRVKRHIRREREESFEVSENRSRSSTVGSYQQHQLKESHPTSPLKTEIPQFVQENPSSTKHNGGRLNKKMIQQENDVLNMIYMIIIVFLFCYLPAQIVFIMLEENILNIREWKEYFLFHRYMDVLYALPSAIHPILYGTMSKVVALNWR